jgi:hypothetical protein
MAFTDRPRPRVSRETRLLLTTVFLSLAALWVLARIRFPERPRTPNPVAPLLTQLTPGSVFEDLERAVFELEPHVASVLQVILVQRAGSAGGWGGEGQSISSLRFRSDAVVALIDNTAGTAITGGTLVAYDRATGLAILRTASSEFPSIETWKPQPTGYPRYFLVSDVTQGRVSLRPVFFGHVSTAPNSAWSGDVWRISSYTTVPNGAFVFSTSGALAGLIIGQPDNPAIVPADAVISLAQRLLSEGQKPAGWLGIDVEPLSPEIRAATGVSAGVVVTQVAAQGGAAGKIVATDIIEAADDHVVQTKAEWETHTARLTAGDVITLRIWRSGRIEQVRLMAVSPDPAVSSPRLGLTLRFRSGAGAEVLSVEEGSVAMRAGVAVDDVLTRLGDIAAPTPAQVTSAFAAAAKDGPLLVAITRGTKHFVVALVKQ